MRFAPSLITVALFGTGAAFFACSINGDAPVPPADAGPLDAAREAEAAADDAPSTTVGPVTADVQLLDLSSLRGQVEPLTDVDATGQPQTYGGLEALAAYFAKDRAETPATLLLTGGDVIGSTPALSALNDDLPTLSGLNLLGAAAATFGAHDFEHGDAFLGKALDASVFRWVSTNIPQVNAALGPRPVTPFVLVDVAQTHVKVAVLGLSDPTLATLVPPNALGTATVNDPVAATNTAAAAARAAGAHVVVALAHFGATGTSLGAPFGPLLDYARQVRGVDIVFGGQTDQLVSTTVEGGPRGATVLVQNRDRGRTYAKVKVHVEAGVVTAVTPTIVEPIATNVAPDPAATTLLKPYRDGLSTALDGRLGKIALAFARNGALERTAEAPIGDFVADAMLDQYATAGAQIALVNAGTLTAGLPSSYTPVDKTLHRPATGDLAPFDLVAGDAYASVQTSSCVVRQLSGQVLWSVLETSVGSLPKPSTGFLHVSGLAFSYKAANPAGARVQSVALANGHAISKDATLYTVVMTDATSGGADGYGILVEPAPPTPGRRVLVDVLREYIPRVAGGAPNGIGLPTGGRITAIP